MKYFTDEEDDLGPEEVGEVGGEHVVAQKEQGAVVLGPGQGRQHVAVLRVEQTRRLRSVMAL